MSSDAPVDICNTPPSQPSPARPSRHNSTLAFCPIIVNTACACFLCLGFRLTRRVEWVIHLATGELLCSTAAHEHRHLAPQLRVKHECSVLRIGRNVGKSAVYHRCKVGMAAAISLL